MIDLRVNAFDGVESGIAYFQINVTNQAPILGGSIYTKYLDLDQPLDLLFPVDSLTIYDPDNDQLTCDVFCIGGAIKT